MIEDLFGVLTIVSRCKTVFYKRAENKKEVKNDLLSMLAPPLGLPETSSG